MKIIQSSNTPVKIKSHPGHEQLATEALAPSAEGIAIAPALSQHLESQTVSVFDTRAVFISFLAVAIALLTGVAAQILVFLIQLITNISFYGKFTSEALSPAGAVAHLGPWLLVIPILGGVVVGIMARYGSKAIRGHGIPEAMEQVLLNESRIPPKLIFLKPVSTAVSIGTGGPFGAEGPIIATGGAIGSFIGQMLKTTAQERKVLLAAGAAAGMSAIFGTPVSAVLLAVELLLFEFKPRSIIPVALAAVTAAGYKIAWQGSGPVFPMADIIAPNDYALAFYIALGGLMGLFSVIITKAVYIIEDAFERLPIHWMWWPALGGIAVGITGYFDPRTLGVGYTNIEQILSHEIVGQSLLFLGLLKFVSWSISLGSGTSGGTLAPLLTVGGALGGFFGELASVLLPGWGIDPKIAALVAMAATFAGASRALLASAVFAFEATLQPLGLLPLLGGCSASYIISSLLMRHSIMTEKIARRGVRVPVEYSADYLDQILARDIASNSIFVFDADDTLTKVQQWIASGVQGTSHQGFPVVDSSGNVKGILTRRDFLSKKFSSETPLSQIIKRAPISIDEDDSLRKAVDLMASHRVGRLAVVSQKRNNELVGIITRSDVLNAHKRRLDHQHRAEVSLGPLRQTS